MYCSTAWLLKIDLQDLICHSVRCTMHLEYCRTSSGIVSAWKEDQNQQRDKSDHGKYPPSSLMDVPVNEQTQQQQNLKERLRSTRISFIYVGP